MRWVTGRVGVVVITLASHARGREFNPRIRYFSLFPLELFDCVSLVGLLSLFVLFWNGFTAIDLFEGCVNC